MKLLLRTNLIILISVFSLNGVFSQSKSLKLNTSTGIDLSTRGPINNELIPTGWLGRLAPVFSWKTQNKVIHQVEWSSFKVEWDHFASVDGNTVLDGEYDRIIDLKWRYQVSFPLSRNASKVVPYLGGSVSLGTYQEFINPYVANRFRTSFSQVISTVSIVPSLRFNSDKRVFFDLEVPFDIIDTETAWNRTDNPSLPIRQQRTTVIGGDIIFLSRFQARFGLGVNLGEM